MWVQKAGHLGELAFLILWRYFCSRMCPVLSWKSRDTCMHGSSCVAFLKAGDGMVGLFCLSLLNIGESVKCLMLLALIFRRWLCHAMALLDGAGPLQDLGSKATRLESPFATTFASSSALSFPGIPSWPGVTEAQWWSLHAFSVPLRSGPGTCLVSAVRMPPLCFCLHAGLPGYPP